MLSVDLTDFDGPGQPPLICIGPAHRLTHAPTYKPTLFTSAPTQSIFAPTENSQSVAPSIIANQNTITPTSSPSESPSQYLLAIPSVSPAAEVGGDSLAPSVAGGDSFAPNVAGGDSFAPNAAGGDSFAPNVAGGDSLAPSVAGGDSFAPNVAGGTSVAPSVAGGSPGFHDSFVIT